MTPLDIKNARAHYNADSHVVYVTYRGLLSAEDSTTVYQWLHDLVLEVGTDHIYGEVFDFRDVQEFLPDNLMDARKKSRGLNLRINVDFPVAMIVKDFYQEEILRGPMQNVPENTRKSIVRSMDEAQQFIAEWHTEQPNQEDDAATLADSQ